MNQQWGVIDSTHQSHLLKFCKKKNKSTKFVGFVLTKISSSLVSPVKSIGMIVSDQIINNMGKEAAENTPLYKMARSLILKNLCYTGRLSAEDMLRYFSTLK